MDFAVLEAVASGVSRFEADLEVAVAAEVVQEVVGRGVGGCFNRLYGGNVEGKTWGEEEDRSTY